MKTTATKQRPGYGGEVRHLNRRHEWHTAFGRLVLFTCAYQHTDKVEYHVWAFQIESWDSSETIAYIARAALATAPEDIKTQKLEPERTVVLVAKLVEFIYGTK